MEGLEEKILVKLMRLSICHRITADLAMELRHNLEREFCIYVFRIYHYLQAMLIVSCITIQVL